MGKLVRILLVCAALAALLAAGPAWAARSPAGIVSDDSGTLSAGQLQALERDLTGLRYHYRVVILGQAFAGDQPADANARFSQLAHDLLAQREVPREAVLITIAMKERLVDFRVYADGPVNQAFLEGTGREFSAHTDSILDQFRGPAGRGDIPGGIVSAVKRIEAIVPIASPGPAPEPVPGPAPVPTPYPPPAVQPVPSPAQPRAPAPAPEPVDLRPVLWWLLGAAAVALAVSMGFRYTGYRKRLKATLAIRDGFLGDLLNLMEKEFPLARKYQGEETRGAVEAAIAAADEALHTQQEAEPFRAKAERSARFGLFGSARQALDKAEARYSRAAEQFGRAKTAWEPVSHCLRHWAALSEEAGAGAAAASSALTAQRVRTAWPLTAADTRLRNASAVLNEARSCRDVDPVRAARLAREAQSELKDATEDLNALPAVEQELAARRTDREQAVALVDEARRSLGLRYVELSPDAALAQAQACQQSAEADLPEGNVDGARSHLQQMAASVQEAVAIVERYKHALQALPARSAELREEIPSALAGQREAEAVLAGLQARYDREDWDDVAAVPGDLGSFAAEARAGLDEVARITSPVEQRYLRAVELLEGWLARRQELQVRQSDLAGRPAQLTELTRKAAGELAAMESQLQAAQATVSRGLLLLPPSLASRMDEAYRELGRLQAMGQVTPVPAHRWAQSAAAGATEATVIREQVEHVARQAEMARSELNRAQAQAGMAMGYASYNAAAAASLRSCLASAEQALAAGHYDMVLAQTQDAIHAAHMLTEAYHHFLREQQRQEEERRRHAEEAHRRAMESHHSSHSSGGGGSWGSDSNKSSGGGGNW